MSNAVNAVWKILSCEAGQHFVSRELLHSFTCYTSQGHTRCQKSRLRLFIEISCVHHGNGCYNLVQVLACKKQHEQLVISCLSGHLLTYILLYITVYLYRYISYIATPHRVLGPVCLIHHGVTEELEIICPCHSRKDKTGISWHFLLSRILSRFLRRVKKCQKSSCSTMQLLLSPSFLDTTCQAPSRITPVGRSRNVNGRIDAGQAHAPRPRHIRPICSDLRTWKVIPL